MQLVPLYINVSWYALDNQLWASGPVNAPTAHDFVCFIPNGDPDLVEPLAYTKPYWLHAVTPPTFSQPTKFGVELTESWGGSPVTVADAVLAGTSKLYAAIGTDFYFNADMVGGDSTVTLPSPHGLSSGEKVGVINTAEPEVETTFFIKTIDDTSFQFTLTNNGQVVDLTGMASHSCSFCHRVVETKTTAIRRQHIVDLRTRIDREKERRGLAPESWSSLSGVITAAVITEMRAAVQSLASYTQPTWTDSPLLVALRVPVSGIHYTEIEAWLEDREKERRVPHLAVYTTVLWHSLVVPSTVTAHPASITVVGGGGGGGRGGAGGRGGRGGDGRSRIEPVNGNEIFCGALTGGAGGNGGAAGVPGGAGNAGGKQTVTTAIQPGTISVYVGGGGYANMSGSGGSSWVQLSNGSMIATAGGGANGGNGGAGVQGGNGGSGTQTVTSSGGYLNSLIAYGGQASMSESGYSGGGGGGALVTLHSNKAADGPFAAYGGDGGSIPGSSNGSGGGGMIPDPISNHPNGQTTGGGGGAGASPTGIGGNGGTGTAHTREWDSESFAASAGQAQGAGGNGGAASVFGYTYVDGDPYTLDEHYLLNAYGGQGGDGAPATGYNYPSGDVELVSGVSVGAGGRGGYGGPGGNGGRGGHSTLTDAYVIGSRHYPYQYFSYIISYGGVSNEAGISGSTGNVGGEGLAGNSGGVAIAYSTWNSPTL